MTLAMGDAPEPEPHPTGDGEVLPARIVSPAEPRQAAGLYWGYTTRLAAGLSAALQNCPFEVGDTLWTVYSHVCFEADAPDPISPEGGYHLPVDTSRVRQHR